MKSSLTLEAPLPTEQDEDLQVECESSERTPERYTLRIPAYGGRPSESVVLTGEEFDRFAEIVSRFRGIKGQI